MSELQALKEASRFLTNEDLSGKFCVIGQVLK